MAARHQLGGAALFFVIDCHRLGIAALVVVVAIVRFGCVAIGTASLVVVVVSSSSSAASILLFWFSVWSSLFVLAAWFPEPWLFGRAKQMKKKIWNFDRPLFWFWSEFGIRICKIGIRILNSESKIIFKINSWDSRNSDDQWRRFPGIWKFIGWFFSKTVCLAYGYWSSVR